MTQTNIAAVLPKLKANPAVVQERPVPTPGPTDILIRNHAFAANPLDYVVQDTGMMIPASAYPMVLGVDAAGIIEAVGADVTQFKKGDRVAGYAAAIANQNPDHGAAQTYLLLPTDAAAKIPDHLSYEEAAVFPMAIATAGHGIFRVLGVPQPSSASDKPGKGKGFLVWSAAGSVGVTVVQLASDLGFTVIATASPKHHEYLRSLGAAAVLDYNDPDVVQKVIQEAKDRNLTLDRAYDAVSNNDSLAAVADVLSKARSESGTAKLAHVRPWPEEVKAPEGVEPGAVMAFGCWWEKPGIGRWLFNDFLAGKLQEKTFKVAPEVQIVEGGLSGVQKSWDLLRKGVSGRKLVVPLP